MRSPDGDATSHRTAADADPPRFEIGAFRASVHAKYADVAVHPGKEFHFHNGRTLADRLGYPEWAMDRLPPAVVDSFCGMVNMPALAVVAEGDVVIDVGCGSGVDAILASGPVGRGGSVTGIDLADEMVEVANRGAAEVGVDNARFVTGLAEDLPLADSSADVAMTNAVINLCPDKPRVLAELRRALVPGGRLYLGDVLLERVPPRSVRDLICRWTSCVVGGVTEPELFDLLARAGFGDIELVSTADVFGGARGEANADHYGALAYAVRARAA